MIQDRHAQIAERAYELWEAEGKPAGRDIAHWLRAEAELNRGLPLPLSTHATLPVASPQPHTRKAKPSRSTSSRRK